MLVQFTLPAEQAEKITTGLSVTVTQGSASAEAAVRTGETDEEKVVFLHYPPVYPGTSSPQVIEVMREFGVKRCFYGHLHGASVRAAVQGEVDGLEYRLISADALRFCPHKI